MNNIKTCDICNKEFSEYGNNPTPFKGEVCCDECNYTKVLIARKHESVEDPKEALLFQADGTVRTVKPKDKNFTLKELQSLVGGLIELYPKRINGHYIVCNEEGLILDLEINNLFRNYSGITLVGDVLVCPLKIFEEPDGEEDE